MQRRTLLAYLISLTLLFLSVEPAASESEFEKFLRRNLAPQVDEKQDETHSGAGGRAAAEAKSADFHEKNNIADWPNVDQLIANPYAFEGKVVATFSYFKQMIARDQALFVHARERPFFVLTDVPEGVLTQPSLTIVAGYVDGQQDITIPVMGQIRLPVLKAVDVYVCKDQSKCSEIMPAAWD